MTRIGKQVINLALAAAMAMGGDVKAQLYVDNLCTACARMGLSLSTHGAGLGSPLSPFGTREEVKRAEEAARNAAELRLHTARLYGYSGYPMQTLHISILWSGPAASVKTELRRFLRDTGYGRGGILVAWHTLARRRCGCLQHGICTTGSVSTRIPTRQPGMQTVGMSSRAETSSETVQKKGRSQMYFAFKSGPMGLTIIICLLAALLLLCIFF